MKSRKQLEDIIYELGVLKELAELWNSEQNNLNNQVFQRWLAHAYRENALKNPLRQVSCK